MYSRTTRKALAAGNLDDIRRILDYLSDMASSTNPNSRKGGVIGLASFAIGLGPEFTKDWIEAVTRPMLSSLDDPDLQVRYYTCEALYNVMKQANGDILILFDDVFDKLARLSADNDAGVRNATNALDKLLKNIIEQNDREFDITALVRLLHDRALVKDMYTKQFVVSWVTFLKNKMLNVNTLTFLPALLDGLFAILAESNDEIRRQCDDILAYFLKKIKQSNTRQVQFERMINLLLVYTDPRYEEVVRYIALTWINEFLNLSALSFVPYLAGTLSAILPCLSLTSAKPTVTFEDGVVLELGGLKTPKHSLLVNYDIQGIASSINDDLMQLLTKEQKHFFGDDDGEEGLTKAADRSDVGNTSFASVSSNFASSPKTSNGPAFGTPDGHASFCNVIQVLKTGLQNDRSSPMAKLAILRWIGHLMEELPLRTSHHLDSRLIESLIETLTDASKEVSTLSLQLLCRLLISTRLQFDTFEQEIKSNETNQPMPQLTLSLNMVRHSFVFSFLLNRLVRFLFDHSLTPNKRGQTVVRQMCVILGSDDVYRSFAQLLLQHSDLDFVEQIVQILNKTLFTSSELYSMRDTLKKFNNQTSVDLFVSLYTTWCFSPISALSLCFLCKNYRLAHRILKLFSQRDDVTAGFLQEIDKLVQLIESPIFACKFFISLTTMHHLIQNYHILYYFYRFAHGFA